MEEVCCEFKYSGVARLLLACAAACTLAIVAFVPFPREAGLLAIGWVIVLALHAHRALGHPAALRLDCARAIAVRGPRGEWRTGAVRDGSFVAPWLTIVRWRPEDAHMDRTLVILPGMLSAEAMRKVRVILKWA